MAGPYSDLLADLDRLQARRRRELPSPRQLRKARARLNGMVGRVPLPELLPAFARLRELESEVL